MDPSNDATFIDWLNLPNLPGGIAPIGRLNLEWLIVSLGVNFRAQTVMSDLLQELQRLGSYDALPDDAKDSWVAFLGVLKRNRWTRTYVVTPTPSPTTSPSRKGPGGGSNQGDGGTGGTGVAASS